MRFIWMLIVRPKVFDKKTSSQHEFHIDCLCRCSKSPNIWTPPPAINFSNEKKQISCVDFPEIWRANPFRSCVLWCDHLQPSKQVIKNSERSKKLKFPWRLMWGRNRNHPSFFVFSCCVLFVWDDGKFLPFGAMLSDILVFIYVLHVSNEFF